MAQLEGLVCLRCASSANPAQLGRGLALDTAGQLPAPCTAEILRNISDAQYWRMMEHLIKFRPAFNWFPESGGRAFDFTIASLRRRHQNMKALLY